jgi:hypothetical protein
VSQSTQIKGQVAPVLQVKFALAGQSHEVFLKEFLAWKSGPEDASYSFAKDGLNRGSKHLSHAHILPTLPDSLAKWNFASGVDLVGMRRFKVTAGGAGQAGRITRPERLSGTWRHQARSIVTGNFLVAGNHKHAHNMRMFIHQECDHD